MIDDPILNSFTFFVFFFNDTATTEIYTLSLHDALPISLRRNSPVMLPISPLAKYISADGFLWDGLIHCQSFQDRKSTRLNSSHANISYAVFCLKKKKHSN